MSSYKSEHKKLKFIGGGEEHRAKVTLPDGRVGYGKSGSELGKGNANAATQAAAKDAKSKSK